MEKRSGEATTLSNIKFLFLEKQEYAQTNQYFSQSIELSESITGVRLHSLGKQSKHIFKP
ncbi:MAG: hypothetical protein VKJ02_09025 [Snowella sp.]|nr:hypothetical protein [Snowella sp.]